MKNVSHQDNPWPDLPLNSWQDTYATLHMWLQIAGKIALTLAPMTNHWWQTTLAVSSRGLTTSLLPCGERIFQIDFDFIDHQMRITADSGDTRAVALKPRSVADFYDETMRALRSIGIEVSIWTTPVEVETRIPFEQDNAHSAYDPEYAGRHWRILKQVDRVKEVPLTFHRQSQPRPVFLGFYGPGGHPLLRASCSSSPRLPQCIPFCHAGSIFTGG